MMANGDTGTVLVTGPTSGLGRGLTLELADRAEKASWPLAVATAYQPMPSVRHRPCRFRLLR